MNLPTKLSMVSSWICAIIRAAMLTLHQAVASLWLNKGETITQERANNRTIATVKVSRRQCVEEYSNGGIDERANG